MKVINWLWLSHHREQEAHRCVRLPLGRQRSLALCARCLGLYPTLAVVLAAHLVWSPPLLGLLDWLLALGLAAPALFDWGISRLGHRGRNRVRLLTGSLLGIALGRSLYYYFRDPQNEIFWVQAALLGIGALAFEGVRRLRLD